MIFGKDPEVGAALMTLCAGDEGIFGAELYAEVVGFEITGAKGELPVN